VQQEQLQLSRTRRSRRSLGSPRKAQANITDEQQQQQQPQMCRSPSRRISLNSSPRRPGHRHSCGARPKSPDTSGIGSSPLRMMRRSSGPISPRPTVSGPSSGVRKSGTDYLNSATEQGGPLEVDEISDAVDKIIRQKMDAAWAHVCDRFNIPYDAKVQPSRSPVARSVSPRVRS